MKGYYQTYSEIFDSISDCVDKSRIVPCLILIYTGLDSFSSLANRTRDSGRKVFMDWTKTWMLAKYPLACNEIDIYAARCGLLHSQKSESVLSQNGLAKELYYAWGNAEIKILEKAIIDSGKQSECLAIKIEDLITSFRNGVADCFKAIYEDYEWAASFEENAKNLFMSVVQPH